MLRYLLYNNYTGKELNEKNILNAIAQVTRWQELGLQIDVPPYKLEEIRLNSSTVAECKIALITHWLNSDDDASWEKLADALERDYHTFADGIRKKYISSNLSRKPALIISRMPKPTLLRSWSNPLSTQHAIVVSNQTHSHIVTLIDS